MSARGKGLGDAFDDDHGTITMPRFSKRKSIRRFILAVFISTILFAISFHNRGVAYNVEESILRYLSLTSEEQARLHNHQLALLEAGLRQCANIKEKPISVSYAKRTNPRAVDTALSVLIKNATLIDGDGSVVPGRSILLSEGVIREIGANLGPPTSCKVIDAGGRYVSPGLVDMV